MTKPVLAFGLMLLCASWSACSGDDDHAKPSCASPSCTLDSGSAAPCLCEDGSTGDGDQDRDGHVGDGDGDGDADGGDGDGSSGDGDASAGDAGGDGDVGPVACSAAKAPDMTGLTLAPVVSGLSDLVYAAQPKGTK